MTAIIYQELTFADRLVAARAIIKKIEEENASTSNGYIYLQHIHYDRKTKQIRLNRVTEKKAALLAPEVSIGSNNISFDNVNSFTAGMILAQLFGSPQLTRNIGIARSNPQADSLFSIIQQDICQQHEVSLSSDSSTRDQQSCHLLLKTIANLIAPEPEQRISLHSAYHQLSDALKIAKPSSNHRGVKKQRAHGHCSSGFFPVPTSMDHAAENQAIYNKIAESLQGLPWKKVTRRGATPKTIAALETMLDDPWRSPTQKLNTIIETCRASAKKGWVYRWLFGRHDLTHEFYRIVAHIPADPSLAMQHLNAFQEKFAGQYGATWRSVTPRRDERLESSSLIM